MYERNKVIASPFSKLPQQFLPVTLFSVFDRCRVSQKGLILKSTGFEGTVHPESSPSFYHPSLHRPRANPSAALASVLSL